MTRGINKTIDRKSVRSKSIAIRFNSYEIESIQQHLNEIGSDKGISSFIRELVVSHIKPNKAP
jgi:hypothetical protein